jgi:hypothetical protein
MMSPFSWRQWIKQCVIALNRPRAGLTRKRRRTRVRPSLEWLEDRLAPAAVSWTGNAGDLNWGTAGNWSNNAVPTSADDVTINISVAGTINIGAASYARTLSDTTASVAITSGGSLTLSPVAATSTFAQNVTVQSGGTLTVGAGATLQIVPAAYQTVTLTDDGTLTCVLHFSAGRGD